MKQITITGLKWLHLVNGDIGMLGGKSYKVTIIDSQSYVLTPIPRGRALLSSRVYRLKQKVLNVFYKIYP